MPTIADYVTPTSLFVYYNDKQGNAVDADHYGIADRESFIANIIRVGRELSTEDLKDRFRDFAEKLSWRQFYIDGELTFIDDVDYITYTFQL